MLQKNTCALIAIENDQDAQLILESIKGVTWSPNSKFILLHVLRDEGGLWDQSFLSEIDERLECESRSAYKMLNVLKTSLEQVVPGAVVETIVTYGSPTPEILATMSEINPNVLIVGSHCRNRLSPLLRESVSKQVLRALPSQVEGVYIVSLPPLDKKAQSA